MCTRPASAYRSRCAASIAPMSAITSARTIGASPPNSRSMRAPARARARGRTPSTPTARSLPSCTSTECSCTEARPESSSTSPGAPRPDATKTVARRRQPPAESVPRATPPSSARRSTRRVHNRRAPSLAAHERSCAPSATETSTPPAAIAATPPIQARFARRAPSASPASTMVAMAACRSARTKPASRPAAYASALQATRGIAQISRASRSLRHRLEPGRHETPPGKARLAGHRQRLALADDRAGECRAGGTGELHGQVAAEHRRIAGDEDGLEVARTRHEHRLATLRLTLHQHLVPRAEQPEIPLSRPGTHERDEPLQALARDVGWDGQLGGKSRGGGTVARREDEGEGVDEADRLHSAQRLLEVLVRLAGETDDDVRGEREPRHGRAQPSDALEVFLARIATQHALERARRAALHRQVHVLAHSRYFGQCGDHPVAEIVGMRAGEAHPPDAWHTAHPPQEVGEVVPPIVVRVHGLTEQHDLAHAVGDHSLHL